MLNFKTLMSCLLISSLVVLSACSQPEQSNAQTASTKTYRLKLAETWGPNFPVFGDTSKKMAAMVADTPMKRFGTVKEVAAIALLLASDEAAYMTGSEVQLDGGLLAGSAVSPGE